MNRLQRYSRKLVDLNPKPAPTRKDSADPVVPVDDQRASKAARNKSPDLV